MFTSIQLPFQILAHFNPQNAKSSAVKNCRSVLSLHMSFLQKGSSVKYTVPLKSSVQAIFVTKLIHVEIQEHPSASETLEAKFPFKSASPTTLQIHKSLT